MLNARALNCQDTLWNKFDILTRGIVYRVKKKGKRHIFSLKDLKFDKSQVGSARDRSSIRNYF